MENTKLVFLGNQSSSGQEMQIYCNGQNEIWIEIYGWETPDSSEFITLDKTTAVKLVKILKREISKIQD